MYSTTSQKAILRKDLSFFCVFIVVFCVARGIFSGTRVLCCWMNRRVAVPAGGRQMRCTGKKEQNRELWGVKGETPQSNNQLPETKAEEGRTFFGTEKEYSELRNTFPS